MNRFSYMIARVLSRNRSERAKFRSSAYDFLTLARTTSKTHVYRRVPLASSPSLPILPPAQLRRIPQSVSLYISRESFPILGSVELRKSRRKFVSFFVSERPTEPVAWWDNGEILGGRDGLAGAMWLACSRNGKIAFVTNVREVGNVPEAKSRGDLPVRFLESKKNPTEFAEEVVMEAHRYNGFNLISMVYVSNRPKDDEALVSDVPPGIHVLSTASLDTPWPNAVRLKSNFENFLEKYGAGELPAEEMADKLMTDTTKADKTMLHSIYSVEFEYSLSSIFVEANTKQGCYTTRSISAVSVKTSGEVAFYEKYLEEKTWKEHTASYMMEQTGTG